jgi:hypothetical protein
MPDSIEFGKQQSSLRRNMKYSVLAAGTIVALYFGHEYAGQSTDSPSSVDNNVRTAASVSLSLDNNGHALVFSTHGSELQTSTSYANIQEIEDQKKAEVFFVNVHCEANQLRGDMVANTLHPLTSRIVRDMIIPENQLSELCQSGDELPAAHVGKLVIAGSAYPYALAE